MYQKSLENVLYFTQCLNYAYITLKYLMLFEKNVQKVTKIYIKLLLNIN